MKKILAALFVMLVLGATPAFANGDPDMQDKANETLKKEFAGAELVEWTDLGNYQRALFIYDNNRVEAYFDIDGEMIGFDRNVSINQLPLDVLRSFTKRFNKTDILDILEIKNSAGTFYRLNVITPNTRYYVKISSTGTMVKVVSEVINPA